MAKSTPTHLHEGVTAAVRRRDARGCPLCNSGLYDFYGLMQRSDSMGRVMTQRTRERPDSTAAPPQAASDHSPLGSAFQENAAKLYTFIYAKVGNREAAEDLTSQVFLKAARWLAEDRSADSIRAWLYTTA